ncbi:MAG TPA: branched-chain amino acid ABC transporter permease [Burkholderiales bacterium]|nr:branched-chain amino acid ABC transporter permease [Burkholderiales bacterium]
MSTAPGIVRIVRFPWHEAVFWLVLAAGFWLWPKHLPLASQVLIAGLFTLSYDLILGYSGILSLGHAAYFGIGAYAAGLLAQNGWGEPLSGLLAAGACAGLTGFLTSFLVVRGQDLTRLMVTTAIGLLLFELANRLSSITGGVDGLLGIEMAPLLGAFRFDMYGRTAYGYCLAITFLLFLVVRRLVHSPFGWSLRGMRDNPGRMLALGYPVSHRLIAVYSLSAAIAGVAGALLTQTTQFVSIDVFSFGRSADVMVMLIVGGAGMLYGGLVGAAVFTLAYHYLSALNPVYWQFWLGAFLIAIVLVGRGGVLGAWARAVSTLREKRSRTMTQS